MSAQTYNAHAGQVAGRWTPRAGVDAGSSFFAEKTRTWQMALNQGADEAAEHGLVYAPLTEDGALGPATAKVLRGAYELATQYPDGGLLAAQAAVDSIEYVDLFTAPASAAPPPSGGGAVPGDALPPVPPAPTKKKGGLLFVGFGLGVLGLGLALTGKKKKRR